MNLGFKDFFIGVVHLFVIFLPGSLVLLTLAPVVSTQWSFDDALGVGQLGAMLLFIGASYFFGHLISLLASTLEDVLPSGSRRKEMGEEEAVLRRLVYEICERTVGSDVLSSQSLRRWAALLIRQEGGVLLASIDAKDADRRFFRNIRVVLLILFIVAAWKSELGGLADIYAAVTFAVLTVLAHLRYVNQDTKFTQLVFESVLMLERKKHPAGMAANDTIANRAGGVVFKKSRKTLWRTKYLLVTPLHDSGQWVLPKGHFKDSETPEATAIREVAEEARVSAEVRDFLGFSVFTVNGERLCVANYLMRYVGDLPKGEPEKEKIEKRKIKWCNYTTAKKLLSFPESRSILKTAKKLT